MFPRDEKTEELLSSFLDGELSSENAAEAQRLVAEDLGLSQSFEKMKRIQGSLRAIPSQTLDSGFSSRVLEQARLRASAMGESAPSWIVPQAAVSSPNSKTYNRAALIGIAVLAASLSAVALFYRPDSSTLGLVDDTVVVHDPGSNLNHDPINGEELLKAKLPESTDTPKIDAPSIDSIAKPDRSPVAPKVESIAKANVEPPKEIPSVSNSAKPMNAAPDNPAAASPNSVASSNEVPKLSASDEAILKSIEESMKSGIKSRYLLVVDMSVSKDAWERETFVEILREYDIPFESPVAISDEITKDLSASRLVDGRKGELEKIPGVALVFVKSRAEELDRVIEKAFRLYQDFPDFSFDMSVDLNCQKALTGLEQIEFFKQALEDVVPGRNGLAKSLAAKSDPEIHNNFGLIQFKAARRRVDTAPLESRMNSESRPMIQATDMNPVEYCLFILRPEAK